MNKYQILLKNNEETGSIDYREILKSQNVFMYPRTDTDGLSIFINCEEDKKNRLQKRYRWILSILKCSSPILIEIKKRRRNQYKRITINNPTI